jgi:hypothetical protein
LLDVGRDDERRDLLQADAGVFAPPAESGDGTAVGLPGAGIANLRGEKLQESPLKAASTYFVKQLLVAFDQPHRSARGEDEGPEAVVPDAADPNNLRGVCGTVLGQKAHQPGDMVGIDMGRDNKV